MDQVSSTSEIVGKGYNKRKEILVSITKDLCNIRIERKNYAGTGDSITFYIEQFKDRTC